MPGTVASPTPTVGTLGDSIRVIAMGGPSRRPFMNVDSMIAVSQPAVPPPTIVTLSMRFVISSFAVRAATPVACNDLRGRRGAPSCLYHAVPSVAP